MWPFGSKKKPEPVDLTGIYEDPAKVVLRVKQVVEEGGPYDIWDNLYYEVRFVGEDDFQFTAKGDIFEYSEAEFPVKATHKAIEKYRHHLMRMAVLDALVEEKLKEV